MVLFYLVAYVFGNMGAFLVVEAVARSERSEATAALNLEATAASLIEAVHAHPTLSEAMGEAALAVHGRAIHI